MFDISELLELSKLAAVRAAACISGTSKDMRSYEYAELQPREVKAAADSVLETEILNHLSPLGLL